MFRLPAVLHASQESVHVRQGLLARATVEGEDAGGTDPTEAGSGHGEDVHRPRVACIGRYPEWGCTVATTDPLPWIVMPTRCPKTCSKPGCPTRTTAGNRFCVEHTKEAQRRLDAKRGTSAERGYGPDWRRLRALILRRDPWCRWPGGCGAPSSDVDHIVSRRRGGSDEASNLRGLCHMHHSMKTATEDTPWKGGGGRSKV